MKIITKRLLKKITDCKGAYIFVHTSPDGDCVASGLAIAYSFLKNQKKAIIFTDNISKFIYERDRITDLVLSNKNVNIQDFKDYYSKIEIRDNFDGFSFSLSYLIIMTDCSEFKRIGKFYDMLLENNVSSRLLQSSLVVIDHHISHTPLTPFSYIDEHTTSASELCYYVIVRAFASLLDNALLAIIAAFGIASDTGFFRFVRGNKNGIKTFSLFSKLIALGIEPNLLYASINSGRSIESNLYLAKMIESVKYVNFSEGILALVKDNEQYFRDYGAINRPSMALFDLLLATKDVKVVVYLKYSQFPGFTDASVRVSAKSTFNACEFCKNFSGGGHEKASGFSIEEKMEVVEEKILNLLK